MVRTVVRFLGSLPFAQAWFWQSSGGTSSVKPSLDAIYRGTIDREEDIFRHDLGLERLRKSLSREGAAEMYQLLDTSSVKDIRSPRESSNPGSAKATPTKPSTGATSEAVSASTNGEPSYLLVGSGDPYILRVENSAIFDGVDPVEDIGMLSLKRSTTDKHHRPTNSTQPSASTRKKRTPPFVLVVLRGKSRKLQVVREDTLELLGELDILKEASRCITKIPEKCHEYETDGFEDSMADADERNASNATNVVSRPENPCHVPKNPSYDFSPLLPDNLLTHGLNADDRFIMYRTVHGSLLYVSIHISKRMLDGNLVAKFGHPKLWVTTRAKGHIENFENSRNDNPDSIEHIKNSNFCLRVLQMIEGGSREKKRQKSKMLISDDGRYVHVAKSSTVLRDLVMPRSKAMPAREAPDTNGPDPRSRSSTSPANSEIAPVREDVVASAIQLQLLEQNNGRDQADEAQEELPPLDEVETGVIVTRLSGASDKDMGGRVIRVTHLFDEPILGMKSDVTRSANNNLLLWTKHQIGLYSSFMGEFLAAPCIFPRKTIKTALLHPTGDKGFVSFEDGDTVLLFLRDKMRMQKESRETEYLACQQVYNVPLAILLALSNPPGTGNRDSRSENPIGPDVPTIFQTGDPSASLSSLLYTANYLIGIIEKDHEISQTSLQTPSSDKKPISIKRTVVAFCAADLQDGWKLRGGSRMYERDLVFKFSESDLPKTGSGTGYSFETELQLGHEAATGYSLAWQPNPTVRLLVLLKVLEGSAEKKSAGNGEYRSVVSSQLVSLSLNLPPCFHRLERPVLDRALWEEKEREKERTRGEREKERQPKGRHPPDYISWWEFMSKFPILGVLFALFLGSTTLWAIQYEPPKAKYDKHTHLLQNPTSEEMDDFNRIPAKTR